MALKIIKIQGVISCFLINSNMNCWQEEKTINIKMKLLVAFRVKRTQIISRVKRAKKKNFDDLLIPVWFWIFVQAWEYDWKNYSCIIAD